MARKLFKNEKLGREIDFWGVKKSTHMGDIYIYLFTYMLLYIDFTSLFWIDCNLPKKE